MNEIFREIYLDESPEFPVEVFMHDNLKKMISAPLHWHDYYEIFWILEGGGTQTINSRVFPVSQNDLVVIKSEDVHQTDCKEGDDVKIIVIKFLPQFISSLYGNMKESIYITSFLNIDTSPAIHIHSESDLKTVKNIFENLLSEYVGKAEGFEISVRGYVYVLISWLVRLGLLNVPKRFKTGGKGDRINQLIEYVEKHCREHINLKQVADHFYLNYSYCSRYFKKETGKGFKDYLDYIRVCEAEKMILSSDKKLTQIAEECGFGNSSTFNKIYRRVRGTTPGQLVKNRQ